MMTQSPNSSNDWQELLAGYVLGNLSPEELIQFNQYLAKYPEKRLEIERLQRTLALLPLSLEGEKAPNHLKARIRASAQSADEELEPVSPAYLSTSKVKRRYWNRIWAGISLLTIAALGWQTYRLQQQVAIAESQLREVLQAKVKSETARANLVRYRETVSLLYEPNNRLLSLTGSESLIDASGSLAIIPKHKIAVLALQNVPEPPQNKIYQLWAVVDGRKVDCIKFRPDPDGKVLLQMSAKDWMGTPMVVITLEPEGETPQPTGDMVMSSPQIL